MVREQPERGETEMLWGERKWRVEAASIWLFCLGFVSGRQPPATDPHELSPWYAWTYSHTCGCQKLALCAFLKRSPHCGLRQGLSPNLELTDAARPTRHRDPLSSASIALGRHTCTAVSRSSVGVWSSPSGPHACSASTLQPELSPQLSYWLIFRKTRILISTDFSCYVVLFMWN